MPQPFVVIKNPHVVIRNVVHLDVEPTSNLAGRELTVDFVRIPHEPSRIHSGSSIFPGGKPHRRGYDFIIINPRTLDYVEVNILTVESFEPGETHSSFSYRVQCSSQVREFPRQHQCPDVANPACAASPCDVLGCRVESEAYHSGALTDDGLQFLSELEDELEQRLDEARIGFELEIRKRYPGQALFVRDGYTGSRVFSVDVMPIRRDPGRC
ncbi:MAG: hypothetical protein OXE87_16475 [Chloroflexi bacterium]|nr:hypothetical protein [Chloroflexota bacterium]